MEDVFHTLTIYIRANTAEAAPPLGTVLGNLGLNSIKFCKEFNEFTSELPSYITLGVSITVYLNRTYSFKIIAGPSMGHLLAFLRERRPSITTDNCISLKTLVQLTLYCFPSLPLHYAIPTMIGALRAASVGVFCKSTEKNKRWLKQYRPYVHKGKKK